MLSRSRPFAAACGRCMSTTGIAASLPDWTAEDGSSWESFAATGASRLRLSLVGGNISVITGVGDSHIRVGYRGQDSLAPSASLTPSGELEVKANHSPFAFAGQSARVDVVVLLPVGIDQHLRVGAGVLNLFSLPTGHISAPAAPPADIATGAAFGQPLPTSLFSIDAGLGAGNLYVEDSSCWSMTLRVGAGNIGAFFTRPLSQERCTVSAKAGLGDVKISIADDLGVDDRPHAMPHATTPDCIRVADASVWLGDAQIIRGDPGTWKLPSEKWRF